MGHFDASDSIYAVFLSLYVT